VYQKIAIQKVPKNLNRLKIGKVKKELCFEKKQKGEERNEIHKPRQRECMCTGKKRLNVGLKKRKEYFLLFLSQSNRHFFLANSLT